MLVAVAAPPAAAQSIDRIIAGAAQRNAARGCIDDADTITVCADPDADARRRLPLPTVRNPDGQGAVAGEPARVSTDSPFLSGCGIFAGQRRCAAREAEAYGYGAGRNPVTLVGRLIAKAIDSDAEVGPSAADVPKARR